MLTLRSRFTRLTFALLLAVTAGGVHSGAAYGQEEGIPDDGSESSFTSKEGSGSLCRVWCITHQRHELITCP